MHATLVFYRNSYNSDMTKIKDFRAPAPPRDLCEFFRITERIILIRSEGHVVALEHKNALFLSYCYYKNFDKIPKLHA